MFAYGLVTIALIALGNSAQVPLSQLAESGSKVEYKRVNYRVTAASSSNETFLIQGAELIYGKWYKLVCCEEVPADEINAQKVTSSSMAIFGASGRAYSPTGTTGKFSINLDKLLLITAHHIVPYAIGTNFVYYDNLSTDPNHGCKETNRKITSDTIDVEIECH